VTLLDESMNFYDNNVPNLVLPWSCDWIITKSKDAIINTLRINVW